MAAPGLAPASFDLVWSEGALYNIGLDHALRNVHALLRPGGHLVFTDAVWRKENPPAEVRAGFDQDYPTMAWTGDVLATIERHDFAVLGRFTLPDEAWWTDFYTPMLARIEALRRQHAGDAEAAGVLDELAREPELHRLYSDYPRNGSWTRPMGRPGGWLARRDDAACRGLQGGATKSDARMDVPAGA